MKLFFQCILFVYIVCLASGMVRPKKTKGSTSSVNQNPQENVPKSDKEIKEAESVARKKANEKHEQYCGSKGPEECEKHSKYETRRCKVIPGNDGYSICIADY
ncbi:hypothetical protein GPALN_002330 [Globodera pallida]|nr:hypothetical protein GPALN_002330 [Globodera pallida]